MKHTTYSPFTQTSTPVTTFPTQLAQTTNAELTILPNHANIYRGAIAFTRRRFLENLALTSPLKLIFTRRRNDAFFGCRATREQTLRDDYK